jgi:mono/diheme cytochrome c family protein
MPIALVSTLAQLFFLGVSTASDVTAGRRLAERGCSNCHVVGPTQQQGTSTGAPPFSAIAQMSSTTPMSLRAFLMTSHPPMPDLHLTRERSTTSQRISSASSGGRARFVLDV